jgi:hypothetical protein
MATRAGQGTVTRQYRIKEEIAAEVDLMRRESIPVWQPVRGTAEAAPRVN